MIVVDTSALMAILQEEPGWEACHNLLRSEPDILISAGTLTEALIVAGRRNIGQVMAGFVEGFGIKVIPVTAASARRAAEAYDKWGKGVHAPGLTFGDCFAYEVAKEHGCALLFIGNDFSKTDIESAL